MGEWNLRKTVAFAILYFIILLFTWKISIVGAPSLKYKIAISVFSPIALVVLLWLREGK